MIQQVFHSFGCTLDSNKEDEEKREKWAEENNSKALTEGKFR